MLAVFLAACSTGVAPANGPEAKAHVELLTISPAPMSNLDVNPMLVAELKYDIENYRDGVDYYVAPLFASNSGAGTTFNEYDRLTDGQRLSAASGTVTIRYSAQRELRSSELVRPIKLWFYVMERISAHTTRVIGKTEAVVYNTGG